jgi:hypothetical protein
MQGHTTFNSQISQAIDDIKNTLTKITSFMSIQEKGKFSSQPEPNPRYGVHEVQNTQVEHANSVTILSSGNEVNKEIPTKVLEPKGNLETKDDNKPSKVEDVKERVYKPVAPFPQRLLTPKKSRCFGSVQTGKDKYPFVRCHQTDFIIFKISERSLHCKAKVFCAKECIFNRASKFDNSAAENPFQA